MAKGNTYQSWNKRCQQYVLFEDGQITGKMSKTKFKGVPVKKERPAASSKEQDNKPGKSGSSKNLLSSQNRFWLVG